MTRTAYSTPKQVKTGYLSVPPRTAPVTSRWQTQALPRYANRFRPSFVRVRFDRHRMSQNEREGQPAHSCPPVNSEDQVDNHRAATILVVEDEMIVALDLQYTLERMGFIVVGIASSGREAIRLAAVSQPNVILMDIQLKDDMDGVEAARQIGMHSETAIIYLTAQADKSTLQRVEQTGHATLLFKPFSESVLQTSIEEVLGLPDDKEDSSDGKS
jgi:CheY-like chemotaxis protein